MLQFMYFYRYVCVFLLYLHRASWHSSATLTEGFPCFFLSCKVNARIKPETRGTARTLPKCLRSLLFVLCRSVYCVCVNMYLYCCHRVDTQLQLNYIYHIKILHC